MAMRKVRAAAWGLALFSIVAMLGGVALQTATGRTNEGGIVEHLGLLTAFCSFPVIGALVASRQPRNPLGWLFIAVGVSVGVLVPAMEYAHLALALEPDKDWPLATLAAWLEQWLWYPANMSIPTLALLLFPTGRPPSPRWRWLVWVAVASVVFISIASMIESRLIGEGYSIDNPVGLAPFEEAEAALAPFFAVFAGVAVACLISLLVRFRRSRGEERQQLKLLTYAAVLFLVSLVIGEQWDLPAFIFPMVVWTVPGAMGVAMLRYRLFDIDVVINRTLVYGVVTAILATTYFGTVVLLQRLMGSFTADSDLAVAGSTLVVAALFRPLRERIQTLIDQRFYRRKYDANATLQTFSARLRDQVDIDTLSHDLVSVVGDTMQPAHASLWLRRPEAAS